MAHQPTIWDWPLRLWHWAFAAAVAFCLYSGLVGDIALAQWHMRSGLAVLGLVAFRLGWALWGGRYARCGQYRTTPSRIAAHFLPARYRAAATAPAQSARQSAHTAPGIALALLLVAAVALQAAAGLFASDDIFTEGPLRSYASAAVADAADWLHHRLHWLILTLIGVHLSAHAVYGFVLRDATPLSMFSGRKPRTETLPPTAHFWLRAAATLAAAAGLVWLIGSA